MAAERKPMNGQGQGPSKAEIVARRMRAWDMQLRGKSYREIATELGVSVGTAFNDVEAHAKAIQEPVAAQVRKQALHRLDLALDKLMPRIEGGDVQAIQALLKIEERRAKLLGLDAAIKQDVTVHQLDGMDTALGELIRDHQMRNAAIEATLSRGESG